MTEDVLEVEDISLIAQNVCLMLGLDPHFVAEIVLTPSAIKVTYFFEDHPYHDDCTPYKNGCVKQVLIAPYGRQRLVP